MAVFCGLLAEGALRAIGKRPFEVQPMGLRVEPEGPFFVRRAEVGYTQRVGQTRFIHDSGYEWIATVGEDGSRLTEAPLTTGQVRGRDEVWVFGCSISFGWSVNDQETYSWLLQERFPDLRVVNFGVGGYGTINSLRQFEEALRVREDRPRMAIIAYLSFHPRRNTMLRKRLKSVIPGSLVGAHVGPYARLDENGSLELHYELLGYYEPPLLRQSALVHLVETVYNRYEAASERGNDVTFLLLERFHQLAAEHRVRLVVAGLNATSVPMLTRLSDAGIETLDAAVDLEQQGYRNLPHDRHPSALAHRDYASAFTPLLESVRTTASPALP